MASHSQQIGTIGGSFQRLFDGGTVAGLSERQLLDRFLTRDDPAAFEAIVARHGPMVLGICRRWLDDPNDADDAFQATFLVLVRKARDLRQRDLLANWLHGVALRVARRARRQTYQRRSREANLSAGIDRTAHLPDRDPGLGLGIEIHEELAGLPRDYRLPLVLCYLEGRTHDEAAQELGWPIGTVKGRLARARTMLRDRMARRGLAPAPGLVVTALERTPQTVPPGLLHATVLAASAASTGKMATALAASGTVTILTQETLRAMWISKWATLGTSATLIASLTTGGLLLASQAGTSPIPEHQTAATAIPAAPASTATADPAPIQDPSKVPSDVLVLWQSARQSFLKQPLPLQKMVGLSEQLRDAQTSSARSAEDRQTAELAHLQRINELLTSYLKSQGQAGPGRTEPAPTGPGIPALTVSSPATPPGGMATAAVNVGGLAAMDDEEIRVLRAQRFYYHGLDPDPRTMTVLKRLDTNATFPFENETSLEEVLQYIRQITSEDQSTPNGIQIYLDEVGIRKSEANFTAASTIRIQLEGVPLRTGLRLLLRQLRLTYIIKEGVLIISTPEGLLEEIGDNPEAVKAGD